MAKSGKKSFIIIILAAIIAVLLGLSLFYKFAILPDRPYIMREYTFDAESPDDYAANIPSPIDDKGNEYVADMESIEYEVLEETPFYETTLEFEGLATKQAPSKQEVEIDGVTYILDLVEAEYTEGIRTLDVTDTVEYTGYTYKPQVPETAPISYKSSSGTEITVEGQFVSIEQVGGNYWTSSLVIKARVDMPIGAVGYIYKDRARIPYNSESPAWQGYETDILEGEGLDPKKNQITGARWTSDAVEQNGVITRYAEFTGKRLVADYVVEYHAEGEQAAYNAVGFYRGNAVDIGLPSENATRTVYTVKAVVRYSLIEVAQGNGLYKTLIDEPLILNLTIFILAGALGTCVALFFIFKKRESYEMDSDTAEIFNRTYADAASREDEDQYQSTSSGDQ